MPTDLQNAPPPLNAEEKAHVLGWQRLMYRYYAFALVAMLATLAFAQRYGESTASQLAVLATVVALVVVASFVQFHGKCPRCQSRLSRQTRLVMPPACRVCGVPFPKL